MSLRRIVAPLFAAALLSLIPVCASAAEALPPELEAALAGKYKGMKVTAFGSLSGSEANKLTETLKPFLDKSGIDFQYEGSRQFQATISTRVDANNPPDLADFAAPGLMANFAKAGKLIDLAAVMPKGYLENQYARSWIDMSTKVSRDGKPIIAGVWERVNVKSLVWYPKKAFDAAGYKVPTTWDELMKLQSQIAADGDTPWCIGIESGAATGWPITDWVEELMLRTTSVENYDKWVNGTLPFSSPEVRRVAEIVGKIWLDDKNVYGGRKAILTTSPGDAPAPLFLDPPKCWLHKQGNFITSFFPKTAKSGVDYSFFYLPPIDAQYGRPVEVGGDIWSMFNDRPEVRAVLFWLTRAEHLKAWMATGGAIAPQKDSDLGWYGSDTDRGVAKILQDATVVRFDGSDLMPREVGAGSFWKQMTGWLAGTVDLDTALKAIDASWPKP